MKPIRNGLLRIILKWASSFLLICSLANSVATGQDITFSVNMEFANLNAGDVVVVRGNIKELGAWEKEGQLVLRRQESSSIYQGTLNMNHSIADTVLYKYVIQKSSGEAIWESRGNRLLNTERLQTPWFDDRKSLGIQQPFIQVTFRLDLTEHNMNGFPAEAVAIMGGYEPLSFDLEYGRTEMTQVKKGVWETTVNFLHGTPHDIPFKFAWKHLDEWVWESRPGHTNHVFWLDDSNTVQTILLKYNVNKPGVVPELETSGLVDNYPAIIRLIGQAGAASRYIYELAMHQLSTGDLEAAANTYTLYKSTHPGGELIDDFHYLMAGKIEQTSGIEAAEKYINEQLTNEHFSQRREYYEYLKGELKLNAGQLQQARKHFRTVINIPNSWQYPYDYSQAGLIYSYLLDTNSDSALYGVQILEQKVQSTSVENDRPLYRNLARAYGLVDSLDKRDNVLMLLSNSGTPLQRIASTLEFAELLNRENRYNEAFRLLNNLDREESSLPSALEKKYIQARIHSEYNLENYEAAFILIEEFTTKWPNDSYEKRFSDFKQNIQRLKLENGETLPQLRNRADSLNHSGGN